MIYFQLQVQEGIFIFIFYIFYSVTNRDEDVHLFIPPRR